MQLVWSSSFSRALKRLVRRNPQLRNQVESVLGATRTKSLNAAHNMGITHADIQLTNGDDLVLYRRGYLQENQIKRSQVSALVDSGSTLLTITEAIQAQLDLPKVDEKEAELAGGTLVQVAIVGPVEIRFKNRRALVEAIVLPGESDVLLGAIPMQVLDVLLDPKQEQLIVNPASPDIARVLLK